MSDRVVALLDELTDEQRTAFADALPAGWRASWNGGGLESAAALVVRDSDVGTAELDSAPGLRRVVRIDPGNGAVDAALCAARGVAVDVVSSVSLKSVAEHTVMAMLALLKRLPQATERLRAGVMVDGVEPALTTQESYAYNWVGLEHFDALYGQTVGLVGLGRIAGHAATLLNAFGADVVYTKRTRLDEAEERQLGVRYLPFDGLLQTAKCVSLHARFTPETERMFGAREFALMPEGSFFVNTARGRLVDEDALVAALDSGHLGGAALDVFFYEPLPADSPLLRAPNLLLTPHTGGIPSAESYVLELREAARLAAA
jgi:phosphoglycerate dehydrogenase-like enzyme